MGNLLKLVGEYPTYVLQPGAFLAGAFFFWKRSPRTWNNPFFNVLGILHDQFWTGIGCIDADRKVSMTQIGLILNLWAKVQEYVKKVQKMNFHSARAGTRISIDHLTGINGLDPHAKSNIPASFGTTNEFFQKVQRPKWSHWQDLSIQQVVGHIFSEKSS